MSLYTIADLHLALDSNKPMDIFGPKWQNHIEKIKNNWQSIVKPDDTVVICGDISWGLRMDNAQSDFLFIDSLNGKKIILKGNHDYWWQTVNKLNIIMAELGINNIQFLNNNAYQTEEFIICGSRGWFIEKDYNEQDTKIVNREVMRLRASIKIGLTLQADSPHKELLLFLHYPPFYDGKECKPICDLMREYKIKRCYYGHLHNVTPSKLMPFVGKTKLKLISADYINFLPEIIKSDKI